MRMPAVMIYPRQGIFPQDRIIWNRRCGSEEELGIKADPGKLKFIGMHDGTMEVVFDGKAV